MGANQTSLRQQLSGISRDLIVGYLENVATFYVMQHVGASKPIQDSQEEVTLKRKYWLQEELGRIGIIYNPQDLSDCLIDYVKALQEASESVGQQVRSTTTGHPEAYKNAVIQNMEYLAKGFEIIVEQNLNGQLQL